MSKDLTTVPNEDLDKALEAYEREAEGTAIAGDLLAFRRGIWGRGQDKETVPADARFVANLGELWRGFLRWEDGKPTDAQIVRITEPMPRRSELGDHDKSLWELDQRGDPRDPWQYTERLILREAGHGEPVICTFATSSFGGFAAIKELAKDYRRRPADKAHCLPVVQLGVDSWHHKEFGPIPKPQFAIVGWEPWEPGQPAPAVTDQSDPQAPLGEPASREPDYADLNDEIPF